MSLPKAAKALVVGLGVALGASLGFVAMAQTGDETPTPTGPSSHPVPALSCPEDLAHAGTAIDYLAPPEGATQSQTDALNDYLSFNEDIPAGDASDFTFEDAGDGAVVAVLEVDGTPTVIVHFAELAPDYWVVSGYQSCEEVQGSETASPPPSSTVSGDG